MKLAYQKSELLFPHESVSSLRGLRDGRWRELVERVSSLPDTHEDSLAFSLMMIRLCGCLTCNPGNYRALLGCSACGRRAVRAMKGSDSTLLRWFEKAKEDVKRYLKEMELKDVA